MGGWKHGGSMVHSIGIRESVGWWDKWQLSSSLQSRAKETDFSPGTDAAAVHINQVAPSIYGGRPIYQSIMLGGKQAFGAKGVK